MKKFMAYISTGFSALAFCVAMTVFSAFAATPQPWWTNPQLEWKPFTALPTIDNPYGYRWEINERDEGENPKFFAQSIAYNSGYPGRFLFANASTSPNFIEPITNLSFGVNAYTCITSTPTSSAMVQWNKSYYEFCIGTENGIYRFDEDQNKYVDLWAHRYDPSFIISLGDSLYVAVGNRGSLSGYHMLTPSGDNYFDTGPASYQIWGDPISKRYGAMSLTKVRMVSTTKSIYVSNWDSKYSFDGGQTCYSPIGTKISGGSLYVTDFYTYSETEIIATDSYCYLYIGTLGENFYPLNFPTNATLSTFFYSPSKRLLIAGDTRTCGLYYAILPGPDELDVPKLGIQPAFIMSWSTNYLSYTLKTTSDLENGPWQIVDAPYNTVSNKIQVAVPQNQSKGFFRLTSP